MQTNTTSAAPWAIVSMMGHQQIIGQLDEYQIGGQSFLRVSVPETQKQPAFTRLLTSAAVYSIDFVDEQTARWKAESLGATPITMWDANQMLTHRLEREGKIIVERHQLPAGFNTPAEKEEDCPNCGDRNCEDCFSGGNY